MKNNKWKQEGKTVKELHDQAFGETQSPEPVHPDQMRPEPWSIVFLPDTSEKD